VVEFLAYAIGGMIYLAVLFFAMTFIGPWVILGRAIVMAAQLLWLYAGVLSRQVRGDRLPKQPAGEEAYRQYFYGPAIHDLREATRLTVRRAPRTVGDTFRDTYANWIRHPATSRLLAVPVGLLFLAGVVLGAGLGAVLLALLCLLHASLILLLQGASRLWAGVMRAMDRAVLRARELHNGMLCPHCYERVPYPSYYCSNDACGRRHNDIRPGRYGILRRRCLCGRRLPTLIMTGGYRLQAICTFCDSRMSQDTGHFPELVVPFFGGTAAGKTQLMAAMLMTLETGGSPIAPADRTTDAEYAALRYVLTSHGHPRGTQRALPRAYSVVLGARRRRRLVHLFDTAGERFTNREDTDALRYAAVARTFVFVLDPLSVPDFWGGLSVAQRNGIDRTLASTTPPELVFQQSVQAVRQMGAALDHSRLAVAVSKLDLLWGSGLLDGVRTDDSAAVSAWLNRELGLGNLVRSMHHEFREARFFVTAAVTIGEETQVHPSLPPFVSWCFGGR
jgi:double-GTPase-like protein